MLSVARWYRTYVATRQNLCTKHPKWSHTQFNYEFENRRFDKTYSEYYFPAATEFCVRHITYHLNTKNQVWSG